MTVLSQSDLQIRCAELQAAIARYLSSEQTSARGDLFETGADRHVLNALKALGHHLFSWDYDGSDTECWGFDYMQVDAQQSLFVCLHRNWAVNCGWVERGEGASEHIFRVGSPDHA